MGDIRKNMRSKAEAAAICCCCLLRYQADNTLRGLTAVGTAQFALPLNSVEMQKCSLSETFDIRGKSRYREGRKRALPLNSSLPLKIAQDEKCSL